jgi:hypothetical protein
MRKETSDFCKILGAGAAASAISVVPVVSCLGITGDNGAAIISVIGAAAVGITMRALNVTERPSSMARSNYEEYKK